MTDLVSVIANAGSGGGVNWLLVIPVIVPIVCLVIGVIVIMVADKKKKARMSCRRGRKYW